MWITGCYIPWKNWVFFQANLHYSLYCGGLYKDAGTWFHSGWLHLPSRCLELAGLHGRVICVRLVLSFVYKTASNGFMVETWVDCHLISFERQSSLTELLVPARRWKVNEVMGPTINCLSHNIAVWEVMTFYRVYNLWRIWCSCYYFKGLIIWLGHYWLLSFIDVSLRYFF